MTFSKIAVLVAQRFSLLFVLLATFIHWSLLVSYTVTNGFYTAVRTLRISDPVEASNTITAAFAMTERNVLIGAVVAGILTGVVLYWEKDRTARRRGAVNAGSLIVFCVLATLWSEWIVRNFVQSL